MSEHVIDTLATEWCDSGIKVGDLVLVHSNINRTLRRIAKMGAPADPNIILHSLLRAVGPEGTLLFPLFNFDFPKGITFNIRHTPSQMGALTEAARHWVGAIRTGHPIYSFAAIGHQANLFAGIENFSGYGADSPFGVLHRKGGKVAVIDLPDQNSMTFYHYVEESFGAPYRFHKEFEGRYIDKQGTESTKNFGLFVRDVDRGVMTHVDPMGELLWQKGFYKGSRPKEACGLRVIHAARLYDEVFSILQKGQAEGLLFRYGIDS